jgi:hypothetical protein
MATCKNVEQPGANNPLQDKINPADYTTPTSGDNSFLNVTCDSSVAVGDAVRISGGTYVKAQANNTANSKVIGFVASKSSSTICNVVTTGPSGSIFSGLSEDTNYFLSATTAGALTTSPPTGSGEIVIHLGRAVSNNTMAIQIGEQIRRS